MKLDIAIVGAGPAGLSLARALDGMGLDMAVIDPADEQALAAPDWDGREIALTHASRAVMQRLDLWPRIDPAAISELKDAWVFDGESSRPMRIGHDDGDSDRLGWLVSNHLIRKAAWEAARDADGVQWLTGRRVESTELSGSGRLLHLSDGGCLQANLVVAADGRFSATRRAAGIAARMRDFGKSMLVTRVELEKPHDHVAWEWFAHDRTLALLPLNGNQASAVITLPHERITRLKSLTAEDFDRRVGELYRHRLGGMHAVAERHVYPLVGVWPDRLTADRFACIGDAAVGMHPVTAHGFNLGLTAVDLLADEIRRARRDGDDIASQHRLAAYARRHRTHSLPLYSATNAVVGLFTDDRLPARALRRFVLRTAGRLTPLRRAIARQLTGKVTSPPLVGGFRRV
ncbi:MAG: 5-demethoxyubiquinol-8 5-hydroxylase UbiM [Wenzhouxiangella sp.]